MIALFDKGAFPSFEPQKVTTTNITKRGSRLKRLPYWCFFNRTNNKKIKSCNTVNTDSDNAEVKTINYIPPLVWLES